MAKEPQFPKRDLNQTAVDAIATRIDSYEQQWERRMDRLFEGIERIETRVEEIADFMGRSAEIQIQTQNKIDGMAEMIRQQDERWERRLDRLTESIENQQTTTHELIKLVTVLAQKVA